MLASDRIQSVENGGSFLPINIWKIYGALRVIFVLVSLHPAPQKQRFTSAFPACA